MHQISLVLWALAPSPLKWNPAYALARKSTSRFLMSLRWTYVDAKPPPPEGIRNGGLPSKIILLSNKVCYKVFLLENRQQQGSKAYLSVQKWLVMNDYCTWKFGRNWPTAHSRMLIANQSSFVAPQPSKTPCEKVQLTRIGSSIRSSLLMSLRWIAYVAPKPRTGLNNAKWPFFVSNLNNNKQ